MVNCCVYCNKEVPAERIMQICDKCGVGVWGHKMFQAILKGTETEKEKGNMELGRVGDFSGGDMKEINRTIKNSKNLRIR